MKTLTLLFLSIVLLMNCNTEDQDSNDHLGTEKETLSNEKKDNFKIQKEDGLQLLCSTDNSFYFIDKPRENVYLYTELKADSFSNKTKERVPLNLSIVIDRSGSMAGEKLQYAKEAAIYAVKQLNANDYISIITYGSDVTTVLEPTKVENHQNIINKILSIESNGGTFLSGGMMSGFDMTKINFKKESINRVFLLSDGLANEGITNKTALSQKVATVKQEYNISLSTFGIGLNFNEDLMTDLAEYGGGNYYFINEAKEISSIFQKELNGLSSLVAKDVRMTIDYPNDMLKIEKVYGYKYNDSDSQILIDFSDLFSKETKAVIVKFAIKNLNEKSIFFTTKVNFISTINETNIAKELLIKTKISPTNKIEMVNKNINNFTMQQAILFESNFAIEKAAKELDNGRYNEARKTLKDNAYFLDKSIKTYGWNEELLDVKSSNSNYEMEAKDYEQKSASEQKYIQKNKKEENYKIRKKKNTKKSL